jgi:hypothetical protein
LSDRSGDNLEDSLVDATGQWMILRRLQLRRRDGTRRPALGNLVRHPWTVCTASTPQSAEFVGAPHDERERDHQQELVYRQCGGAEHRVQEWRVHQQQGDSALADRAAFSRRSSDLVPALLLS